MATIILSPTGNEPAYAHAAGVFQSLYKKVTGKSIPITEADDGCSDLIVIGSDAVNDFLMDEVLALRLTHLGIRYGTDDYCIRSHSYNGRKVLILAGGRGRSTLYAVYDYFERYLGCHYFWDGDVIPHSDTVPLEDIRIVETPRFEYRGLRYFAHRGLKRFQAEHWSLADWKQELDWIVKKRLNFFMIRIGMDDIWQRAFPEDVPYPEKFNTITGVDADGFDDRTDFWTLKYRGELKIKVLEYARMLDLTYPVDCGTMTHWYSRTPISFLENKKPGLLAQEVARYTASSTGNVFDFTKKENMDHYMRLTEAMVNEHEKTSALFHTIGLGEREIFKDKSKNFALKLVAYRRICESIRKRYPNSRLMLATWDFIGWWTPEQVEALVQELDPERTLILDYTSEVNDPDIGFMNWGVVGKFPWIFGLFHAYESESELRGPYDRSDERLRIAADDPCCKGMIFWPELSHSDPLVLEYLAENAWSPLTHTIEQITERFCANRYGPHADHMNRCWQQLLPLIKQGDWGGYSRRSPDDPLYFEHYRAWYAHQDVWTKPLDAIKRIKTRGTDLVGCYRHKAEKLRPVMPAAIDALTALSAKEDAFASAFILRDAVDMARTVLGRMLNFAIARAVEAWGEPGQISKLRELYLEGLQLMQRLLSVNEDFSIYRTLEYTQSVTETNPEFEITLKRNIGNRYCSQPAYELVAYLIREEAEAAFELFTSKKPGDKFDCDTIFKALFARFEARPLKDMQPECIPAPHRIIGEVAQFVQRAVHKGLLFE